MIPLLSNLILSATFTFAPSAEVAVDDPFWSPRFELWRTVTIPDIFDKYEKRSFALRNFDVAAEVVRGGPPGPSGPTVAKAAPTVEAASSPPHGLGGPRWSISVNGERLSPCLEHGYQVIDRTWRKGDVVKLTLDVSPRQIRACDKVAALRGMVAEARGPVIYAEELGKIIPFYEVVNHGKCPHNVWRRQP